MALAPTQQLSTPYEDYAGFFLKFYSQGTTTPITMATDSTGAVTLAKAELSLGGTVPIGFIKTAGDVIFIPYIDEAYDAYLFPTAAEADANDTSNAVQVADDIFLDRLINTLIAESETANLDFAIQFSSVAAMVADTVLVIGKIVEINGYVSAGDGGDSKGEVVAAATGTADGGSFIDLPNTTPVLQYKALFPGGQVNAKQFGSTGDGITDDFTAISAALTFVRPVKGKVFFPANKTGVAPTTYLHSGTLEYGASEVVMEGESNSVILKYTGTGTGIAVNISTSDAHRERCGLRNISLSSTTGDTGFDFTSGSYGNYENVEIQYTAANSKLIFATGDTGRGPYFNKFDGITLFGDSGRTQVGISLEADASGNLADGPNANEFSNLKRGADLGKLIDVQSGVGNLFTNIGGESIKDAMIIVNDVPSFGDSGTSTSTTTNTLTDTSKIWSAVQGDPLNFIGAAVRLTSGLPNETRRVATNTIDTLTLDKSWSQDPGATVTYQISKGKAVGNKFVNIRQEGLSSDNPDGIRIMPGGKDNEFNNIEIGSLGTGDVFDDQSQDQSNKVRQGDLVVQYFELLDPGPSVTIEIIPRSGADGGIRSGSNMSLEYVEIMSPNFVTGSATATLTVDHGGAATGAGTETVVAIIDDFNSRAAYVSADKIMRGSSNNGIFASLTTNANVNAAADFTINIGYRVK